MQSFDQMSYLKSDDTLWPLCTFMAEGVQSLDQHMRMLNTWDDWLARETPFTSLRIYNDDAALTHVADVGRTTKNWLREGAGDKIRNFVSAMVIVVPPTSFENTQKLSVEAVFGIPGRIVFDLDHGLEWLTQKEILPGTVPHSQDIFRVFAASNQTRQLK